tara:strand:+ start:1991 stop:2755 length:765 start_codon:yes stop_codon:yes gene_type:complete
MIKFSIFLIAFLINFNIAFGRNVGDTEITTEDGIEVFQEEKYYLLKKNVEILSDEFKLTGQTVKIYFDKDLYDIKELLALDNVNFISEEFNLKGEGNKVTFNIEQQKIFISGLKSKLFLEDTQMLSDGEINVDNSKGSFLINGPNSKLISENINIIGSKISGTFDLVNGKRDIGSLLVEDKKQLNIKTNNIMMFSKKATYNKNKSIIELFDNVKINRGNEIITGDYGILDTKNNSYKVSSNTNKVKAIITNTNE